MKRNVSPLDDFRGIAKTNAVKDFDAECHSMEWDDFRAKSTALVFRYIEAC